MKKEDGFVIWILSVLSLLFMGRNVQSVIACGEETPAYFQYINMGNIQQETRGAGVTIAVIDTGIDTDHEAFSGKISPHSYNVTKGESLMSFKDSISNYKWELIEDEYGHGTAVSGVITQIAPESTLMIIKAELNEAGEYNIEELRLGIRYAVENGADIINMSFGIYQTEDPFFEEIELATQAGVVCIAASGNHSTDRICFPSANEKVIGVGALLAHSWELAPYSNFGVNVDIVAPGTVYTAILKGNYDTVTGTSYTAPMVAGALALFQSKNSFTKEEEWKTALFSSARDLGDLGKDVRFGVGALDVSAFLKKQKEELGTPFIEDEEFESSIEKFESSKKSNGCHSTIKSYTIIFFICIASAIKIKRICN